MVCLNWAYCCWKLKTENWKHCSKIIFKCVNSIVGLMNSAWTVREQYMNSVWIVFFVPCTVILLFTCREKKKKAWKRRAETQVSALPKRAPWHFRRALNPAETQVCILRFTLFFFFFFLHRFWFWGTRTLFIYCWILFTHCLTLFIHCLTLFMS